jgi:hypothetical protein
MSSGSPLSAHARGEIALAPLPLSLSFYGKSITIKAEQAATSLSPVKLPTDTSTNNAMSIVRSNTAPSLHFAPL